MRKAFFLALAVVGCAKAETPADTTATVPPPPPAPAALTAAQVAGTWTGTSKREGTDSIVAFSVISTSDSTGKVVIAGVKDTVTTTTRFDADSMIVTSSAYKDPTAPRNAPPVTFRSVGRLKDGKLVGTANIMPAARPDTVLARVTWELTKAP